MTPVLHPGTGVSINGLPFRLATIDWPKKRLVLESYDPLAPGGGPEPSMALDEASVVYLPGVELAREVIYRVRVTDIEEEGPRWRRVKFYVEGIVNA